MSPEYLQGPTEQPPFHDQVRDSLIASNPQHQDLIMGRDAVVAAYCAERGISKDDITIDQLLEIRALPQWKDPFSTPPTQE